MKTYFLLLMFSGVVAAQALEGDVVNALTGAPIAGAHVSANGMNGEPAILATDVAGHFRFPVAASPFLSVQVVQAGFLRKSVQYKPSQTASLRIALKPAAVISGKIEDEDGFPVERAQVQALRYVQVNGERKLQPAANAQTDDLGQYRLINLPAGRYWIRASSGDAGNYWDRRYVAEYFPGTIQRDDTNRVAIETGQERGATDFRLTRHEGVTVSGRVETPGGASSPRIANVVMQTELAGVQDMFLGGLQRDGSFVIRHVPPGNYLLRAATGNYPPKAGDLLGERKLQVAGADVANAVVALHEVRGVDVAGTVVTDGGGNPPRLRIGLRAMSGPGVSVRSNEDGSFVLAGLLPGHYDIQALPDVTVVNGTVDMKIVAGRVVSARLGDKEVLRTGFDLDGPPAGPLKLAFRDHTITIHGKLVDASGGPAAGALLELASSGQAVQDMVTTGADGTFQLQLTQPGDYRIYLLDDQDVWSDADYLDKHENDFPPFKAIDGANPPLLLRLPARQR